MQVKSGHCLSPSAQTATSELSLLISKSLGSYLWYGLSARQFLFCRPSWLCAQCGSTGQANIALSAVSEGGKLNLAECQWCCFPLPAKMCSCCWFWHWIQISQLGWERHHGLKAKIPDLTCGSRIRRSNRSRWHQSRRRGSQDLIWGWLHAQFLSFPGRSPTSESWEGFPVVVKG